MPNFAKPPVSDLLAFIDASPSPYHVVETVANRLHARGFVARSESDAWDQASGNWYVVRDGAIIAWTHRGDAPDAPFRLVGAHTDSPNLRIKPRPNRYSAGFAQLGVEVYGGVLLNSWLDRDLGVSGRVTTSDGPSLTTTLFRHDEPALRIPQLAIHLDREINSKGLQLNAQAHMAPVWGVGETDPQSWIRFLGAAAGVDPQSILSWDAMTHDLTPSRVVGMDQSMIAAPRLDNQLSCWAAVEALAAVSSEAPDKPGTALICLFDHEEVGSQSRSGAGSSMLETILERIVTSAGGDRNDLHRALAASWCVSADGAHATHPNYADRHEPNHHIQLNAGPAVKINANERYATSAPTHARFIDACQRAEVPWQTFVNRTDLACGSTIGPVTSARLGIATVDAGAPQLAMHSARETAGAFDPPLFAAALTAALAG